jgi:hypothetical protein
MAEAPSGLRVARLQSVGAIVLAGAAICLITISPDIGLRSGSRYQQILNHEEA